MLAASCYLRSLQLAGYFGFRKVDMFELEEEIDRYLSTWQERVPGKLDPVEERVGGLLVSIILSLQFNCHSVTEATDAIQSRSVVEISIDIRQL